MSTPDIPDDKLDGFFRKSLGDPQLEFREEDWLKMEQKLKEKQALEKALFRRYLYTLLGLLLVLIPVITWYAVTHYTQTSTQMVAVRGVENKIRTENPNGDNGDKTTSSLPSQPKNAPELEKADENTSDQNSPSVKPKKAEPAISTKTEKTTQPTITQQNGLSTENQLNKVVPSERPTPNTAEKILEKQQPYDKKIITQKTSPTYPKNPELLTDKRAIETNTKKTVEKNNGGVVTSSGKNNPAEKPTSGIALDLDNNTEPADLQPLSDSGNQKEMPSDSAINNPVADSTNKSKAIQKPGISNPVSAIETPVIIIPNQNKPGATNKPGTESTQHEVATADHPNTFTQSNNSVQNTSIQIEAIPGLSAKLLSYETKLVELITEQMRQAIQNAEPDVKDSSRRNRIAIKRVPSRMSINLLLSPDLSSIGFSQLKQVGTNVGVSLEYHLSNKVSIGVGAIYSNKVYEAAGNKYKPASSYWASYYPKPVDVKGTCKVIDIPVNIRYNFLNQEKYKLYLSGGLSSYLMLREDYKYSYNVYDPNLRPGWHGKNEYKHLFKVVNLSAGYERKLNQRFSLQAEPFIKLPTAGVGYGRIKLLSTGLFMSMKYNF